MISGFVLMSMECLSLEAIKNNTIGIVQLTTLLLHFVSTEINSTLCLNKK